MQTISTIACKRLLFTCSTRDHILLLDLLDFNYTLSPKFYSLIRQLSYTVGPFFSLMYWVVVNTNFRKFYYFKKKKIKTISKAADVKRADKCHRNTRIISII